MATIDLTNKRFGRLLAIKRVENAKSGDAMWLCQCDCGNLKKVTSNHLRTLKTQSCGCYHKEQMSSKNNPNFRHGKTQTRLYNIYNNMKSRCYNNQNNRYKNYGKRGIKICNEWLNNFESFYNWATSNGYRDDLTIERINVNKDYEPNNCKWIPMKCQANNTTRSHYFTIKNETRTIADWSRIFDISYDKMKARVRKEERK